MEKYNFLQDHDKSKNQAVFAKDEVEVKVRPRLGYFEKQEMKGIAYEGTDFDKDGKVKLNNPAELIVKKKTQEQLFCKLVKGWNLEEKFDRKSLMEFADNFENEELVAEIVDFLMIQNGFKEAGKSEKEIEAGENDSKGNA